MKILKAVFKDSFVHTNLMKNIWLISFPSLKALLTRTMLTTNITIKWYFDKKYSFFVLKICCCLSRHQTFYWWVSIQTVGLNTKISMEQKWPKIENFTHTVTMNIGIFHNIFVSKCPLIVIQCPPLNMISLGQYKSDNISRII